MIKVKTLRVQGGAVVRNGVTISDMAQKIEKELGALLAAISPEDLVRVEQTVDAGSHTGGWAFYTVFYKGSSDSESEDAPVSVDKRSRKEK